MTEVFDVEETVQLQFSKRFTLPTYVDGPIPQAKSCDLSEPLQFQKQLILLDAELNKTKSLLNGNFELQITIRVRHASQKRGLFDTAS